MITTCIIPAAGKGSRWAPISGYLPKEMLPLIDKPVIDWVIQEAIDSGLNHIIIILNKRKLVIKDYIDNKYRSNKKIKFSFVFQEQPLGLSHAIWLSRKLIGNQPFCMALPDLPTISKKPVLAQLVKTFQSNTNSHIISFNAFPPDMLHHYTECLLSYKKNNLFEITHFCPKQSENNYHHPQIKLRMSGRYVIKPEIFQTIKSLLEKINHEIKEFDAFSQAMNESQKLLGYKISGHTYDTGNPESYIRANTAFFKKRLAKLK